MTSISDVNYGVSSASVNIVELEAAEMSSRWVLAVSRRHAFTAGFCTQWTRSQ